MLLVAEIPKFKGTPVYNQPIGVVQPMRDTSGEAFQRIGQALFEHDYAEVQAAEESKAKAFGAAAAFGKTKDGGLGPIEIPENCIFVLKRWNTCERPYKTSFSLLPLLV